MQKTPYIDPDLCTGCELCTETAPEAFEMAGDVATVRDTTDWSEDTVQDAIENCPVEAITWRE